MTLVYGKISDMYGRGKVFLIAIALFVGASALCALAGDMLQLVIARGLQGMGAVSVPGGTGKEQLLSLPYIGAHATLGALSSAGAAVLVAGLERAFHAVFLIGAGVAAIAVLLSAQIRGEALKAARA